MIKVDLSKSLVKPDGKVPKIQMPSFASYKVDISAIQSKLQKYSHLKNIIVIGNGGSNTSFKAFYSALAEPNTKKGDILNTMEPDRINFLKKAFAKEDTLVMPISKSGDTVGILESMFSFMNDGYIILPVVGGGTMLDIVKAKNMDHIPHPQNVGGRYSGRTECGFSPSLFCGVDIKSIDKGAVDMYGKCVKNKNPAFMLASALYQLEELGYDDIFVPVYSSKLSGFLPLIIQLMHESVCKNGKGQTVFGDVAPESQHHTNQRLFGGRRNCVALFITVQNQADSKSKVKIPKEFQNLKLRDGKLGDIDNISYEKDLSYEFMGTYKDAVNNKIPSIVLTVDKVNAKSAGEFLAFWQYVAVYSSILRGVDPFNQPQVETSKGISFRLRTGR
jgi:glucose-6-phosphate isomerase